MKNFTFGVMPENMDGIVTGTIFYPISAFTKEQLSVIFVGEDNTEIPNHGYIMIAPDKKDTSIAKLLSKFSLENIK
jgi:hypothetical protein